MTPEEAVRALCALADRARAEGWNTTMPRRDRAEAHEALMALEGLLPAPAREALLAEGDLRWAQVALAAAAVEMRAGGPSS